MNDKIIIELCVPVLDKTYSLYIPVAKRIGEVIKIISKSLDEMTDGTFKHSNKITLYNAFTGEMYKPNDILYETNIKNGDELVLL